MWEDKKEITNPQLYKVTQPSALALDRLDLYRAIRSKAGSLPSEMEKNYIAG